MAFHDTEVAGAIHIIHNFVYANAAARLAASGFSSSDIGKVALQSDTKNFYVLQNNSPTTWSQVNGGGGGGSSGVNFVGLDSSFSPSNTDDRDAENSIGNWAAYQDTAGVRPVDMTGGTPTVTISRTTTGGEVLNGSASFKVVKDAANRQGEGVSVIANLPVGYRTSNAQIKIPFKVISGSVVQGDVKAFIYDITNSSVITPFNNDLIGQQGVLVANWSPNSNMAQLRVGFHFASTSTTAVTFSFDDVQVGPAQETLGLAGTDWQAYTPVISAGFGTASNISFYWSRVGDSVRISGSFTAGTAAASLASFSLPAGLAVDPTKLSLNNTTSNPGDVLGVYSTSTSGIQHGYLIPAPATDSTQIYFGSAPANNAMITPSNGTDIYTGTPVISVEMSVPIVSWSSNLSIGSSSTFKISNFLATGTRVTGTPPVALGQYRSYLRNAGSSTFTETNGAPAISPTVADGIALYNATLYSSADANNNPSRYEIFVGQNKNIRVDYNSSAGRTGFVDTTPLNDTSTVWSGYLHNYDPTTGILSISPNIFGTPTGLRTGSDESGAGTASPIYFDVVVSENALSVANEAVRSEVWVQGGATYGSTNTRIRIFTNLLKNSGKAITYATSATLGDSWTINEDGVYAISYNEKVTTDINTGISVNSTQLSTDIGSITTTDARCISEAVTANSASVVSTTLHLSAGDVVRAHTSSPAVLDSVVTMFRITKVSN